jgi:hypothetical protein
VIVLDENIRDSARRQLLEWRIRIRQIGKDLGRKGMSDEAILPFLLTLPQPTFFTRDRDFRTAELCHPKCCLVFLKVHERLAADFIRKVLEHSEFDSYSKRRGAVVEVSDSRIKVWRHPQRRLVHYEWDDN